MPRTLRGRGVSYLCFLLISLFMPLRATETTASLITAWPGSEIYELCGHEAVRIKGPGIDLVWNFGIFNFAEPNFVYRFVKGETDYMVDSYPFAWFMPEYVARGSRVEEQVLNLTPTEVEKLHRLLNRATTPPNNRYRYNYIKNNCSTQIADLLDSVAGGPVTYPDTVRFPTYREAMRGYHGNYPWYQFGIDIALGSGLEEPLNQRDELFIPVEFNRHAAAARLPDGRPLVSQTNVLYQGREGAVEGPTPFLLTPLWVSIVVAAVSLIIIAFCWRRNRVPRVWYAVYFGIAGLAGILVGFLVFVSEHEATSPNLLIFWLNPLQLLVPICIWWRQMRYPLAGLMWLNVAAVGMLLVLMPIFNRGQAGQTSFLILIATDVVLAAYWLRTFYHHRKNNHNTPKRNASSGRNRKPAARRPRSTADSNRRINIRYTEK